MGLPTTKSLFGFLISIYRPSIGPGIFMEVFYVHLCFRPDLKLRSALPVQNENLRIFLTEFPVEILTGPKCAQNLWLNLDS
jgi:hypothetical protein